MPVQQLAVKCGFVNGRCGGGSEQRSSAAGERHDPRGEGLGKTFDLHQFCTARDLIGSVVAQCDRRLVKPHACGQTQFANDAVIPGGEAQGIFRPVENEKEPVAAIDFATGVSRNQTPSALVMLFPPRGSSGVAESLDERRAVDQVGEEQGVLAHKAPFSKSPTSMMIVAGTMIARRQPVVFQS